MRSFHIRYVIVPRGETMPLDVQGRPVGSVVCEVYAHNHTNARQMFRRQADAVWPGCSVYIVSVL